MSWQEIFVIQQQFVGSGSELTWLTRPPIRIQWQCNWKRRYNLAYIFYYRPPPTPHGLIYNQITKYGTYLKQKYRTSLILQIFVLKTTNKCENLTLRAKPATDQH
jgi:hypothetical protein